ncbi:MAG: RHS repeat-associated core domain-containing protein [Anaerolineales bacterium]|nr:RHS repeat-associated core domain-containing protein [Anaerolineales bacterium]
MRYTPWGETRHQGGTPPTDYGYTGQREEAGIGLYYYNARWYDAKLGRFAQGDMVIPKSKQPNEFDRYRYCKNNPLLVVDPSGNIPKEWFEKYYGYDYDWFVKNIGRDYANLLLAVMPGDKIVLGGKTYMVVTDKNGNVVFQAENGTLLNAFNEIEGAGFNDQFGKNRFDFQAYRFVRGGSGGFGGDDRWELAYNRFGYQNGWSDPKAVYEHRSGTLEGLAGKFIEGVIMSAFCPLPYGGNILCGGVISVLTPDGVLPIGLEEGDVVMMVSYETKQGFTEVFDCRNGDINTSWKVDPVPVPTPPTP